MTCLSAEMVSIAVVTVAAQRDMSPLDIADTQLRHGMGGVRSAICLALGDVHGIPAHQVGAQLRYFDTPRQAEIVIRRFRRSPDVLELVTCCLNACGRGAVSAADRSRVIERLARLREAGRVRAQADDPDRDIVANYIAQRGVTLCPPGSALGVSVLEQHFGVTGFPKGEVWRRSGRAGRV